MTSPTASSRPVWHPVDLVVVAYCLLMTSAILLLGRPLSGYADELAFYFGAGVISVLIVRYLDETAGRARAFIRLLYPFVLFTAFYRVTGGQMFLLFDRFFDSQVVGFERALLGEEPTLLIDRYLLNAVATEILSFCYFCYYFLLPGFLIAAFIRRDDRIIREYLTATCITFFVSYLLFWLYPVEGPRWYLAADYAHKVEGPLFRRMVEFVIANAAVRGGAMPSSHTGVALVTLIFCFRYYRRAAWWLLPVVTGLALGTVWGRFHYLSDTVVGAFIGTAAVVIVWKLVYPASSTNRKFETSGQLRTQNVP